MLKLKANPGLISAHIVLTIIVRKVFKNATARIKDSVKFKGLSITQDFEMWLLASLPAIQDLHVCLPLFNYQRLS